MFEDLDKYLSKVADAQPLTMKATYPRRIVPPTGYLNPKYYSATLLSELFVGFEAELKMLPHITGIMDCLMHLEYRVPTYFVRSEFAQAVAQTEPPEDFKFSEIKWPLPAMLFVLPTGFALRHFGYCAPFISLTHSPKGRYPDCLRNLPKCEMPLTAINEIQNEVDRVNIVTPVYTKKGYPLSYTGSYNMDMLINSIGETKFSDATLIEEERYAFPANMIDKTGLPSEADEREVATKLQSFGLRLLLAISARPALIEPGTLQRAAKLKKGVQRDELWNPNLIGWNYKAKRIASASTGRSHASPRAHWRRGHFRNSPYGPKPWTVETPRNLNWIDPVFVNAE